MNDADSASGWFSQAKEGFYFGAPEWALPAALLGGLIVAALVWSCWAWRRGGWAKGLAMLSKTLAVLAIAVCLLEPLYSSIRPRPGANLFLVAVDNSQSLAIRDRNSRKTRGEQLQPHLDRETPWQTRLSQDFEVRRYIFDSRLRAVDDFAGVDFQGASSTLGASLASLASRYRQRPVAGVLLFTDGNATDWPAGGLPAGLAGLGELPPVYPVVLGADDSARDLEVRRLSVSQTDFEAAPVTVIAEVAAAGYAGKKLTVELRSEAGEVLAKQSVVAPGDGRTAPLKFQTRPESPGLSFYQIRVYENDGRRSGDELFAAPDRTGEATLANNQRLAVVDRAAGPYRVLYVSGRPNWDFKFLRRALEQDPEMELAGLVRIARREPKFEFRGRAGESTNPLFSGFSDKQDEEAQRYDQPVLLRVGVREEQELRQGFPKTADQLFQWHAIILDDIEAEFFSQDQLSLIRRFVSQRGGGLVMMGGPDSFQNGGYRRTPLEDILPVYLGPETPAGDPADPADPTALAADAASDAAWKLSLTRDGWLQPWVRVRSTEEAERSRLRDMPSFHTIHRVGEAKPGALPLATFLPDRSEAVADGPSGERAPMALAAQRFGDGRAAAVMIGDLWRWALAHDGGQDTDLEITWRQTIRWLVSDAPRRVELEIEEAPGDAVRLLVRARDEEFLPLDNASVQIAVTTPSKQKIEISASPSEAQSGVYEATFSPKIPGAYRVLATVQAPDGGEVGARETGFVCEPAAEEFQRLVPNRALLEKLAKETGGEAAPVDRLAPFVASLSRRKAPVTEHWSAPLWHRPVVLMLAIGLLGLEWGLRRLRGMP